MRYWALFYKSTGELAWSQSSDYQNDVLDSFEAETMRSRNDVTVKEVTKSEFDELNESAA